MADPDEFEYDVGISFLASDEALATELKEALQERYKVFVYTDRQKELAGTDGLETFSSVFGNKARVCVVLNRSGWGHTPWTRVEETAIKNRGFVSGWDFLLVIAVETGPPPIWLPATRLWLGYERFGLTAAVGAIDVRIQERGAQPRDETARARATRLARLAQIRQAREQILNSPAGVEAARTEVNRIFAHLEQEAHAVPIDQAVRFHYTRENDNSANVTAIPAQVRALWQLQYGNSLKSASLLVLERLVDEEALEPAVVNRTRFRFFLDELDVPGWQAEDGHTYTSIALAEWALKRLLANLYPDSTSSEPTLP